MKVILAQPRGFCAGVVRAIEIVERALEKYGPPVYVRREKIGEQAGAPSYLVADGGEIDPQWFRGVDVVGVTAGASAPEVLVDDVVEALKRIAPSDVSVLDGPEENVSFRLPAELAP